MWKQNVPLVWNLKNRNKEKSWEETRRKREVEETGKETHSASIEFLKQPSRIRNTSQHNQPPSADAHLLFIQALSIIDGFTEINKQNDQETFPAHS